MRSTSLPPLPPGYTRGVCIGSFEGLLHYRGHAFIHCDRFMQWKELETYSFRQLLLAIETRQLYYARQVPRDRT